MTEQLSTWPNRICRILLVTTAVFLSLPTICLSQKDSSDKKDKQEEASIFGSFEIVDEEKLQLKWTDFKPVILEKVELAMPPFPENWLQMTPQQRDEWATKFSESEEGKKFQEEQAKKIESRKRFEIHVEDDGTFAVYDVPPGDYVMEGWLVIPQKENPDVKIRIDAFGEFTVSKDAEEMELGSMDLMQRRVFASGDPAPGFKIESLDGKLRQLSDYRGSYLLLDFWAAEFGSSEFMLPHLKKVQSELTSKYKLKILSVSLDQKKTATVDFVNKNGIDWDQAYVGDWEDKMVVDFGVRSSPSFWLIDPEGKVALTNGDIMQRYQKVQSLAAVMEDFLSGKNELKPEMPKEGEDKK